MIYIPSLSRATAVHTLLYTAQHPVTLVVTPAEYDLYKRHHPGIPILTPDIKGIAKTRQFIIDTTPHQYIFFADDDGRFFVRPDLALPKLVSIKDNPEEQTKMWSAVFRALRSFPMVGVSYRSGNNHVNARHKDNTKLFSFWGVDVHKIRELGINIGHMNVMEDFYLNLSLLTRGYRTRCYYKWAWDQQTSNAPGGCSVYRTLDYHNAGARQLHAAFPEFVTLVSKKPKSGWFGDQERLDVRVQWKKAYQQ